jgi:hypothetical protein
MFSLILMVVLPFWTLLVFFLGTAMGSGTLDPREMFHSIIGNRRAISNRKAQEMPFPAPNMCQCKHMRSFHNDQTGCQGMLYADDGEPLQKLCTCSGYISSMAPEVVVDTYQASPVPPGHPGFQDHPSANTKALEMGKTA